MAPQVGAPDWSKGLEAGAKESRADRMTIGSEKGEI